MQDDQVNVKSSGKQGICFLKYKYVPCDIWDILILGTIFTIFNLSELSFTGTPV